MNWFALLSMFLISAGAGRKACAQELIDHKATAETRNLYNNLRKLSKSYVLFGHQDDLAYGVNWKYEPGRSDIKDVVEDYPAVYGWDIGYIEKNAAANLDGVPFAKMRKYIQEGYQRGAAITLSWHFDNPMTGGNSWDAAAGTVASILPGGLNHRLFKSWLDRAATFMASLKGSRNEPIPLLFRPFHELNGDWFWWGRKSCTAAEYKQIWQFTVDYLIHEKQLHNLIFVYNMNSFSTAEEFMERYPGNDMADVLSFDKYQYNDQRETFISSTRAELEILTDLARKNNKLAAFSETGYEGVPDAKWWTETLWPIVKGYPISYVLVWRNAGYMESTKKMHYYGPYKSHPSAADFETFYKNPQVLFEKKLGLKNIYQPQPK